MQKKNSSVSSIDGFIISFQWVIALVQQKDWLELQSRCLNFLQICTGWFKNGISWIQMGKTLLQASQSWKRKNGTFHQEFTHILSLLICLCPEKIIFFLHRNKDAFDQKGLDLPSGLDSNHATLEQLCDQLASTTCEMVFFFHLIHFNIIMVWLTSLYKSLCRNQYWKEWSN